MREFPHAAPRPTRAELTGALAGAGAIGLAYAAGRRFGLTRSDLARSLAPGAARRRPCGAARARHARGAARRPGLARPRAPLADGAALGALASRDGRAFSAGAHALAALVAQRVAARL